MNFDSLRGMTNLIEEFECGQPIFCIKLSGHNALSHL